MINIISHLNGVGLSRDVKIISDLLTSHNIPNRFTEWLGTPSKADVNIFLELVNPKHFAYADKNYLIPNPEWFDRAWIPYLEGIDLVICKTYDAQRIFQGLGCNTVYTGFTSPDRFLDIPNKKGFVHLPGKSLAKSTSVVMSAFSRNKIPLLLYSQKDVYNQSIHVTVIRGRVDDEKYKIVQNANLVHVCPSTYEGFGHYINEAKSTGAVVITTDGAPMNELITPEFGFLCPCKERPRGLVVEKVVDAMSLVGLIKQVADLPTEYLREMGKKAREDYLERDKKFKQSFIEIL